MHKVDTLAREAGRDGNVLFLHVEDEGEEAFNLGRWDIVPVRSLNEGLGGTR